MRFFFNLFFKVILILVFLSVVGISAYRYFEKDVRQSLEPIVDLPTAQVDFIHFILVRARISNEAIFNQRKRLLGLYQNFLSHKRIPLRQRHWLEQLALSYKENNANFNQEATWQNLMSKVDIVPNGLVIAQAIEESGWGRSRFAKEANNFFGLACYGANCGLSAMGGASVHHLQIFMSPLQSVSGYMLSLNSLSSYTEFREVRQRFRSQHKILSSLALADTLSNYSTHPEVYMDKIASIIRTYKLTFFDGEEGFIQESMQNS